MHRLCRTNRAWNFLSAKAWSCRVTIPYLQNDQCFSNAYLEARYQVVNHCRFFHLTRRSCCAKHE